MNAFRRRTALLLLLLTLFVCASVLIAADKYQPPFGDWKRVSESPVLSPSGDLAGVFNPAVIRHNGEFFMLARSQDIHGTSSLQSATSTDGIHFTLGKRALVPEADYERSGGLEDPRLVKIGDTYYLTYTGYNKKDAQLCLAVSKDLLKWERMGVILSAYKGNWNVGWTKSGAIVNEKINGKYWMYFLGTAADKTDQAGLVSSTDLIHWTEETQTPVLPRRRGMWDSRVVEPGPPPVITKDGILLIYNGADEKLIVHRVRGITDDFFRG